MTTKSGILAGTALGLLMVAPSFGTSALAKAPRLIGGVERSGDAPLVLTQANGEELREKLEKRRKNKAEQQGGEKPARQKDDEGGKARRAQPEAEAETSKNKQAEQAGGEKRRERKGGGAAQRGEAAPAPEPKQEERKQKAADQDQQPTAGKAKPEQAQEQSSGEKKQAEERRQRKAEERKAEERKAEKAEDHKRDEPKRAEQSEGKRGQAEDESKREAEPKQAEQRRDREAKPERGEAADKRGNEKQQEKNASEEDQNEQERAQRKQRRDDASRKQDERKANGTAERQENRRDAQERNRADAEDGERNAEAPESRANRRSDAQAQRGEALPENAAPVLDSQKRQTGEEGRRRERARDEDRRERDGETARDEQGRDRDRDRRENARDVPLPDSDRAAQRDLKREEFQSLTSEKGKRIDREAWRDHVRRDRHHGASVVKEFGDRFVLRRNNQTFVQSSDQDRLRYRSRDVYYEELPRDRTREVIVRDNGFKVVTIRDRYGDIIRRSRIAPDGHEYVLVYASDRDAHGRDRGEWRDPGRDLPPLNLTIPASEYILESERVRDPDVYYRFLEEPPVEPVEQLYSLDDVKYSARVRDKVRRIDLDTINFEFGSPSVSESEVDELEAVADAMGRLLDENPAETFLIEGHTDAVGSDVSNLALSDERAASVASALTDVFGIPPENLVTQGYGEQYLKIETGERERENRRVAIRRITPLVTPVASAQ